MLPNESGSMVVVQCSHAAMWPSNFMSKVRVPGVECGTTWTLIWCGQ